jgi:hypothetical protein
MVLISTTVISPFPQKRNFIRIIQKKNNHKGSDNTKIVHFVPFVSWWFSFFSAFWMAARVAEAKTKPGELNTPPMLPWELRLAVSNALSARVT